MKAFPEVLGDDLGKFFESEESHGLLVETVCKFFTQEKSARILTPKSTASQEPLTEFSAKLGESCSRLGELAVVH